MGVRYANYACNVLINFGLGEPILELILWRGRDCPSWNGGEQLAAWVLGSTVLAEEGKVGARRGLRLRELLCFLGVGVRRRMGKSWSLTCCK